MRRDCAPAASLDGATIDHALIADDEPHLLDYLAAELAQAWPGLRITRAANGVQALELIDALAPDVVFLDIRMPGLNGLDLAARLCAGDKPPRIVFTTAHEEYALAAFEHAAFDYLLKPVKPERLQRTVERLRATLRAQAAVAPVVAPETLQALLRQLGVAPAAAPAPLQWIRAAQGHETRLIAIDEVVYFQSSDKYTSIYLADGESLIRMPLSKLKEQLDPQQFWQIHRSVIVAARHVAGTRTDFRGRLHVKLKGRSEELVVSRNYVDLFRQM